MAINDHTSEIQRSGYFYAGHVIYAVHLWVCFLPGVIPVSVKEAGSPPLTNTSAGTPMDPLAASEALRRIKSLFGYFTVCLH